MANIVTVSSIGYDILPEMQSWVGRAYKDFPTEFDKIFTVLSSDRAEETFAKITGMGLPNSLGEAGTVDYDDIRQFWRKTITHVKYGQGVMITRDALDDQKSGLAIEQKGRGLGRGMAKIKELLAAAYIDNAHTTANGGDGVALCSASHPRIDGGTVSNTLSAAADLSEQSLEDSIIQMMGIVDERGLSINVQPQKLIVSKAHAFEVARLLQTVGQVYTPDNTINAIKELGMFPGGSMVNHYLSDADAFYITTDAVDASDGLVFYNRRPMEISADNVFDNENAKFKSIARFSFGHKDPLCIFGSPGV